MKKNKNNTDWLQNVKKDIKDFEDSKYAKLSDGTIKSIIGGSLAEQRYDPKYQSEQGKKGGPIGAEHTQNIFREKYGDEYDSVMKEQLYNNVKDKTAFHSAGGKKTGAIKKAEAMELCRHILDRLPIGEWFSVVEYEVACNAEGKAKTYFNDLRRFHFPGVVESNGARGKNAKCIIHKKTW